MMKTINHPCSRTNETVFALICYEDILRLFDDIRSSGIPVVLMFRKTNSPTSSCVDTDTQSTRRPVRPMQ